MTLAYTSLSSIVVYGVQRSTFTIVSYILLAFGIIGQLLMMAAHMLNLDISDHLISGITNRIVTGMIENSFPIQAIIEYAAFIVISSTLAVLIFNKKEMEF